MKANIELPKLRIPAGLQPDQMPDLLRYWYLGTRARRHMMLRRFSEVDARAAGSLRAEARSGRAAPRALDIGSAWGFNVMALERLGFDAVGIDLVIDQFEVGARIAGENGAGFKVAGADASRLPFADGTFDAITMVETFEHIFLDDRREALSECRRVLRPGGVIVLSTPNYGGVVERLKRFTGRHPGLRERLPTMCYPDEGTPRGDYHPYRYHHPLPDDRILELLQEAGLRVESVSHFLFMLKNAADWAYPLASLVERASEALPGLRRFAATSCFVAGRS
jgi:SAM-dependent methyltransferase